MLIDLSMPVDEQSVVFPGDDVPKFQPTGTFAEHDVVDTVVTVNIHLGTHIDAPAHMVKGGALLDSYSVDRFKLSAVCIDARSAKTLAPELLEGVDIPSGGAVLFCTGASERNQDQSYATDYPQIDKSLADALVQKGVSMVGVDMISFDHDEPFPIHKTLLEHDILLIENLANLAKVLGKAFQLYAFPAFMHLEAAPARVVAEL